MYLLCLYKSGELTATRSNTFEKMAIRKLRFKELERVSH